MQYTKLFNPLKVDFEFKWDSCSYLIKAGETRELDPNIAKHGAKHLVDRIILSPESWSDIGLKRESKSLDSERDEIFLILFKNDTAKEEEKVVEKAKEEKKVTEEAVAEKDKVEKEFEDLGVKTNVKV